MRCSTTGRARGLRRLRERQATRRSDQGVRRRLGRRHTAPRRRRTSAARGSSTSRARPTAICPNCARTTASATAIDVVEFHPAYHELMGLIYGDEAHSFAWTRDGEPARTSRARALSYLWNQGENGICCPMGMTFASIPALRHDPSCSTSGRRTSSQPPTTPRPIYAKEKTGVTVGMAMTEKQGGSDLRATMTTARPATARRGSGAPYLITGHKWFFSVPMSDVFLTLAQTEKGLSCFLATGWLPDGSRNRLQIQRLKDKCGNKSNASSEVEFYDLDATMLGEEGQGIRTIIEMAHLTRLDFAIGSSGLMRQALSQAIHHTTNRRAFQRSLIDLPIMRNVIADLAVEGEAMMWMSMRLAAALDREPPTGPRRCCRASARRWRNTGPASAHRSSSPRRSNAMAATASSRIT